MRIKKEKKDKTFIYISKEANYKIINKSKEENISQSMVMENLLKRFLQEYNEEEIKKVKNKPIGKTLYLNGNTHKNLKIFSLIYMIEISSILECAVKKYLVK